MRFNLSASREHSMPLHSCSHAHHPSKDLLMDILEKVSAVALGAFSFYKNARLFIPFFGVGICIGIYNHTKNGSSLGQAGSSCTSSLLEQITGAKLPPVISLGVNVASTFCHIKCHGKFFVPIIGISLGNGMGNLLVHLKKTRN